MVVRKLAPTSSSLRLSYIVGHKIPSPSLFPGFCLMLQKLTWFFKMFASAPPHLFHCTCNLLSSTSDGRTHGDRYEYLSLAEQHTYECQRLTLAPGLSTHRQVPFRPTQTSATSVSTVVNSSLMKAGLLLKICKESSHSGHDAGAATSSWQSPCFVCTCRLVFPESTISV